jgi:hypothetical protein
MPATPHAPAWEDIDPFVAAYETPGLLPGGPGLFPTFRWREPAFPRAA